MQKKVINLIKWKKNNFFHSQSTPSQINLIKNKSSKKRVHGRSGRYLFLKNIAMYLMGSIVAIIKMKSAY